MIFNSCPNIFLVPCVLDEAYFQSVFLKHFSKTYFENVFLECISKIYFFLQECVLAKARQNPPAHRWQIHLHVRPQVNSLFNDDDNDYGEDNYNDDDKGNYNDNDKDKENDEILLKTPLNSYLR